MLSKFIDKSAQKGSIFSSKANYARGLMFNLGRIAEKGDNETGMPNINESFSWYEKALKTDPTNLRYSDKVNQARSKMSK